MSFTNLAYATKDTDLIEVMEGWKLDNQVGQWRKVPRALVNDRRSQRSNRTTYDLMDLSTWLPSATAQDGGLFDWDLGDALPAGRVFKFKAVSVEVTTKSTHPEPRPAEMPPQSRIRDLVNGLVPGLMSILNGGLEVSLVNHIKSVTPTALTGLTGGTIASAAAGEVIKSFEAFISPLRVFTPAGSSKFGIVCYMTDQAIDLLRGVPDYAGRGNNGGSYNTDQEAIIDDDEFAVRFMRAHKLKDVRVISSSAVNARQGVNFNDTNLIRLGGYEIYFVVEDQTTDNLDIRSTESQDAPDGGLYIGMSREPEVIFIDEDRQKTEMVQYVGRAAWQYFSPRGDVMRLRVDPTSIV